MITLDLKDLLKTKIYIIRYGGKEHFKTLVITTKKLDISGKALVIKAFIGAVNTEATLDINSIIPLNKAFIIRKHQPPN